MTLIESAPHLALTPEVSALSSKTPLPRNTAPEVVGLARTQPKRCLPTGASFKSAPVSPRSNLEESPSFLKQRQRVKKDLDKKRDKYPESASLGWRRTQQQVLTNRPPLVLTGRSSREDAARAGSGAAGLARPGRSLPCPQSPARR